MHQAFTRIEAGDQNYYLLTNLFEGGKNGLDLTVCNGEQVWRETGKVITRQDKTRQCFIWSLIQSYVHRLYANNLHVQCLVEIYEQCQRCQPRSFGLAAA